MGEPHKWKEVIKAWADGASIQTYHKLEEEWVDNDHPQWDSGREYRIKPEPQYPVTRYKAKELYDEIYAISDAGDSGWDELVAVADAAIRRAIEDGDVILPNND